MRYEALINKTFEVQGWSGEEAVAKCPWHDDRGKPNLYINAKRGVYICHACGVRGHLSNITKELPPLETADLRERVQQFRTPKPTEPVYPEGWLQQYDFPTDYWTEARGFSPEVTQTFGLGYDPFDDIVTVPIRNRHRQVLGVIQRRLDDQKPKYNYPKGMKIGKHLFGEWMIEKGHRKVALVEGPLDAIACWDGRVPALALMGARITGDQFIHLQEMNIQHVVIMTDNDRAGQGFPFHMSEPVGFRGKIVCDICGSQCEAKSTPHKPSGVWAIKAAMVGIQVSVGYYRPYWVVPNRDGTLRPAKDPGELSPAQRRKMFHSAIPWHRWKEGDIVPSSTRT